MKKFFVLLFILPRLLLAQSALSSVSIEVKDNYRYIEANSLTKKTPSKSYQFRVPLNPEESKILTPLQWENFGASLNGIPFDPNSNQFWDLDWGYTSESDKINLGLDRSYSGINPETSYYSHSTSKKLSKRKRNMLLVGWAADGFPIYSEYGISDSNDLSSPLKKMCSSYRLKSAYRKTGLLGKCNGRCVQDYEFVDGLGDLDVCNGRFGKTPEYPKGIYHYFLTNEFPYIPRYFKGKPDPSFLYKNLREFN